MIVRELNLDPDPERAFAALFGTAPDAFWLDSSRVGEGARFSFLGAPGPEGAAVSYRVAEGAAPGELTVRRPGRPPESRRESIFEFLERELDRLRPDAPPALPFEFDLGFVGWFGYELKAETGGRAAHRAATPDAAFLLADRLLALDHDDGRAYLLALTDDGWVEEAAAALAAVPAGRGEPEPLGVAGDPVAFSLARPRERYLADVAECLRALREGESYEINLTDRILGELGPGADPFALYRALRRVNPAPYAAFLRLAGSTVLSSSPERFLRVGGDGAVEAKPIKGTAPRGDDAAVDAELAAALAADPKNRAENLMIVDLLRNDLGRVCEIGSVEVPRLMEVESFETVHQLVSTVRGRLRPGVGALDALRASFPPGSMTGAPKERTMAIIDRLEGEARGVYSGALGWLGRSGAADLSVVIRTIVLTDDGSASIGVGGAITVASDPEAEFEEALLKGRAPMRALDPTLPPDYSRVRLSASTPRVTPRRSSTSDARATRAP